MKHKTINMKCLLKICNNQMWVLCNTRHKILNIKLWNCDMKLKPKHEMGGNIYEYLDNNDIKYRTISMK